MAKPIVFLTEGMDVSVRAFGRMEEIPQKCVTKAARKGANVIRKAARGEVPVATGALKRGIVLAGEKRRLKGKKVYDVTFSAKMNDIFQKPIKNPGAAGGKNKKGYYPASMEYGYLTRSKGGGLQYVEGRHFLRSAAVSTAAESAQEMVTALNDAIDKEWSKK